MKDTFSQIITSQQQDPDQYQFPSELQVVPSNNIFRKDDYLSLVSLTMKDLYSSQGKVLIYVTDQQQVWTTIQLNQNIDNISDLMYEFKTQQIKDVNSEVIQISAVFDSIDTTKFRRFQFKNLSTNDLKLQATGNLQNLFGIHNDIILKKGEQTNTVDVKYNQLDDNSMRIQYIKVCCEQVNACMQNTVSYKDKNKNIRNKQLFSTDVLAIVNRSSKFCYSNKNLDVHLQLLKNPPLTFRITDQDDRLVNISYIVLELMFYQKDALNFTDEVGSPSQIKGHTKQQMFISLETNQQEIQLPRAISQISLSDASGSLNDITLSINNSHIQIMRYNCEKYPLTFEEMKKLNEVDPKGEPVIPDLQMGEELYAIYQSKNPQEQLTQDFYLYNEPEFKDYQNKFIDYDFLKCLQIFMQRIFEGKVGVNIEHIKQENKINIITTYIRNNTVQNNGMVYFNQDFYYYGIQFVNDPNINIVNRIFFKDQIGEGVVTNLYDRIPENIPSADKKKVQTVVQKVNLAEMFCYSSMFYIQVEQQDFDRILGVIVGDNLVLQPTNKSVFLWKNVYAESKKLTFKIISYVETDENKLVQVESKYIPNMQLRLLIK
ncbi:Conserved_hypothetical protein [Hexamita inflata]|uniref:Uncharacterized protein n=1 Tax=Hexamita inflata TaxID=28002 RepID=A0AA86P9X5_9EUKA|nr:Conserved hypothetical protein [Hexamita inflata]